MINSAPAGIPNVLYIMGTARSGTTILEILLGANPGVAGVGELTHIFEDAFLGNEDCGCGASTKKCELWKSVQEHCGWSEEEAREIMELVRRVEWHGRFPLVVAGMVSRADRARYELVHRELLTAIGEVLGVCTVVDSSQYAARALLLARAFPNSVRVLCLTRRPAGLISAFQKPNPEEQRPKSIFQTVAYYTYVVACLRLAAWMLGDRVLRIRFEDLKAKPDAAMARIADWAGLDLCRARYLLAGDEAFSVGHIVTGNRLRKAGRVRFERGEEPHLPAGLGRRLVIGAMEAYRRILHF